jgi:hypothetical protein
MAGVLTPAMGAWMMGRRTLSLFSSGFCMGDLCYNGKPGAPGSPLTLSLSPRGEGTERPEGQSIANNFLFIQPFAGFSRNSILILSSLDLKSLPKQ